MVQRKRVTVIGAARSGRAAAVLALREGASEVVLTDLREDLEPIEGVHCVFGGHEDEHLAADIVVVSPGVPASAPPVKKAQESGALVLGELAFAASFLPSETPLIAITGTNGKSTVTSFTAQLLQASGLRTFAGGNLGTPLSAAVGSPYDAYVVEVSSYQLELPGTFTPSAAAVLNLAPDHLARHKTMECYAEHKCRLFDHMSDCAFALLPHDAPLLRELAEGRGGRRLWIGAQPGVTLEGEGIHIGETFVDLSGLGVIGLHNRLNAGVACVLAHGAGLELERLQPEVLTGLPHRMEPVQTDDGLLWVNDSKATNVHASLATLSGLDRPFIVLLGGQGKTGADYSTLKPLLLKQRVVCFGASAPEIAAALNGCVMAVASGLEEAVGIARKAAQRGEAIVLSPACASFDEFTDFEHRGDTFRALARSSRWV